LKNPKVKLYNLEKLFKDLFMSMLKDLWIHKSVLEQIQICGE